MFICGKNKFLASVIVFMLFSSVLSAAGIVNGDFETGTLTGWTTQLVGNGSPYSEHFAQIMTVGYAEHSNNNLNIVHSGNYAAGIYSSYSHDNHADFARISRSVTVPAIYTDLELWFSAVVNIYHVGGVCGEDAYVLFEVLSTTTTVYSQRFSACDNAAMLEDGDIANNWKYLPWTQIDIPLALYVGQTLTVVLTAYNCYASNHPSYGYIDDMDFVEHKTMTITPTFSETQTQTHTITPTITQTSSFPVTFTPTPTLTVFLTLTPTPVFSLKKIGVFPNPAVEDVNFIYWISRNADVKISVYTVSGEKVTGLNKKSLQGYNAILWNGENKAGKGSASGVFLYLVEAVSGSDKDKYFSKLALVR